MSFGGTKSDEFYTRYFDIESEMVHYKHHFEGKVVYCNCDDPDKSMFWQYFIRNFDELKLWKVVATHYKGGDEVYMWEKNQFQPHPIKTLLAGNGDFRSIECIAALIEADIVVTNPPFSLAQEFIALMAEHEKDFIIIGDFNSITYDSVFDLIQRNKMWCGVIKSGLIFKTPKGFKSASKRFWVAADGQGMMSSGRALWFTNLEHKYKAEFLPLEKKYYSTSMNQYPDYDNYDAIEVKYYKDIPSDYYGKMGVPVTFIKHYNPKQFEIVGLCRHLLKGTGSNELKVKGQKIYRRIIIKRVEDRDIHHPSQVYRNAFPRKSKK